MQQVPLHENLARVRTSTHGCQIVSRLHAFGSVKNEINESGSDDQRVKPLASDSHRPSRRIWTLVESEKIRDLILQGQATIEALRRCFPDRSDFALRSKQNAVDQELSARPWSTQEDQVILQFVSEGRNKALSIVFRGRDESSIRQRLRELTARPSHDAPPLFDVRKKF
jgi:hypothetical protein